MEFLYLKIWLSVWLLLVIINVFMTGLNHKKMMPRDIEARLMLGIMFSLVWPFAFIALPFVGLFYFGKYLSK